VTKSPGVTRISLPNTRAGYADELVKLADLAQHCTRPEQVQAIRLMVNTRQWVISKLLPKKYGDQPSTNVNFTQNMASS
jgi:hypothetical protein